MPVDLERSEWARRRLRNVALLTVQRRLKLSALSPMLLALYRGEPLRRSPG